LVLRQVYELFAGNCKPEDVLAAGKKEGKRGSFYRHLYYWLYWEAENDRDRDRKPAFSKQCQNPSRMTIPGTWQKFTKKCQVGVKVKERSPAVCINRTLAQKTQLRVKIFVVSHRS
jgi:IS30 family transposase